MIDVPAQILDRVRPLCIRYRVACLEFTGSAAREDFDPQASDIDLLVEFLPEAGVSAIEFVEFATALEAIFGRRVDLIELSAVTNPILREAFLRDRVPFYAAA